MRHGSYAENCVTVYSSRRLSQVQSSPRHLSIVADFSFFFLGQRRNSLTPLSSSPFLSILSSPLPSFSLPSCHSSLLSLSSSPLPIPSCPSPRFRIRPPKYSQRVFGECCKLPQWSLGRNPSRQTIWCILVKKCSSGGSSFC